MLVGSYPNLFTLTLGVSGELFSPLAVSFLCHFPSAFAVWDFPSVLPCGVRTFLGPARSRPAVTRPARRIVARLLLAARRRNRPKVCAACPGGTPSSRVGMSSRTRPAQRRRSEEHTSELQSHS